MELSVTCPYRYTRGVLDLHLLFIHRCGIAYDVCPCRGQKEDCEPLASVLTGMPFAPSVHPTPE